MSDIELYSAVTDSPVGALTIVASDRGLRAILWPTDTADRVLDRVVDERSGAPGDRRNDRPTRGVLLRGAHGVRPAARSGRHTVPAIGLEHAANHPVRRDDQLRRAGGADGGPSQGSRRRGGERSQPDLDRRPVPPGRRHVRLAHGVRRRGSRPRRGSSTTNAVSPVSRLVSDTNRYVTDGDVRRGCGRRRTAPCGRARLPSSPAWPRRAWPALRPAPRQNASACRSAGRW